MRRRLRLPWVAPRIGGYQPTDTAPARENPQPPRGPGAVATRKEPTA